jgi:hypothetical protein
MIGKNRSSQVPGKNGIVNASSVYKCGGCDCVHTSLDTAGYSYIRLLVIIDSSGGMDPSIIYKHLTNISNSTSLDWMKVESLPVAMKGEYRGAWGYAMYGCGETSEIRRVSEVY